MTFGEKIIEFYKGLEIKAKLPDEVEVLNPYKDSGALGLTEQFFQKYYSDSGKRVFLVGINPGRLGSGATGIGFTDPVNLQEKLGIENDLEKRHELSSRFIYQMIDALGGPQHFYRTFFFTSVSPLGFVRNGKNLNYYDIPELQESLEDFMVNTLKQQIEFGAGPVAYSLGQGKNIAYLKKINEKHNLFREIRPLPHPRWIMQYRLKKLNEFIGLFREELSPWFEAI